MNLKQIDDLAMQAANYIEELQKRIAELESENAELKKINFQQGFHIAELQGELDLARMTPIREQIAALVKPLEWVSESKLTHLQANSFIFQYEVSVYGFGVILKYFHLSRNGTSGSQYDTIDEARAAAEAHHRETVLNLLNL